MAPRARAADRDVAARVIRRAASCTRVRATAGFQRRSAAGADRPPPRRDSGARRAQQCLRRQREPPRSRTWLPAQGGAVAWHAGRLAPARRDAVAPPAVVECVVRARGGCARRGACARGSGAQRRGEAAQPAEDLVAPHLRECPRPTAAAPSRKPETRRASRRPPHRAVAKRRPHARASRRGAPRRRAAQRRTALTRDCAGRARSWRLLAAASRLFRSSWSRCARTTTSCTIYVRPFPARPRGAPPSRPG